MDQFNFSEALLRPVKLMQFGVFSPEEIVRFRSAAFACALALGPMFECCALLFATLAEAAVGC